MMSKHMKKMCSVVCAFALLLTCFLPGLQSVAADIVSGISDAFLSIQSSTRDTLPVADIYGLRCLIGLADAVDVSQSAASQADIDVFRADLAQAKAVEQNGSATADAINDAYNNLAASYNVLCPIVDASEVYVLRSGSGMVFYDQVKVDYLTDYRNYSQQYEILTYPYDSLFRSITWSSSNPNVSVSPDGVVTPLVNSAQYTQITVTVTTYDGRVITNSPVLYVCFAQVHVNGLTIERESMTGYVGETYKLGYTLSPQVLGYCTANIQDVVWSINVSDCVTLDADGTMHFNQAGGPEIPAAVVRVTAVDGGSYGDCWVYVDYNRKALQARIDEANLLDATLYTAESWQRLTQVLAQAVAVNEKDFYSTRSQQEIDDATAALADAMQSLEPLATIDSVVITHDGSPASQFNSIKVGTFSNYSSQTFSLGIAVTPSDAAYQSVTWSSSDTGVTVDSSGTVKPSGNNAAAAKITATVTDYNGRQFSDSVYVSFVRVQATGVSLSSTSLSMSPGATDSLSCTIDPQGTLGVGAASIKTVIWESSDPAVATVSSGTVTAVDGGTATITCTTMDGGYTASCSVAVTVDKTALAQALYQANSYVSTPYTADSYSALQEAIRAGNAVNAREYPKTAEVSEAVSAINAAINGLQIRPADYMALYQVISAFEALVPERYTPESYAAVQQAVNAVVYDLPYTEQARVDAMAQAIQNAIGQLEVRPADYTAVNEAVAAYEALFSGMYTAESYAAVQQAVNNVVYGLTYEEQARVEAMAQAINDAIAQLVELTADYSAVYAAVSAFEALDPDLYTPESYARVQQAVNAVVYDLPYSEQERVDVMAQSINNTIALLEERSTPHLVPVQGSGVVVNETNHFIYGIQPGTTDVLSLFSLTDGGSVTFTEALFGRGTGSTLTLYDRYGDPVDTFTLVIFGDVNGDLWYDGTDAYFVRLVLDGLVSVGSLTEAQIAAADCDHNGWVNRDDVALLEQAGLLLEHVDQTLPHRDLAANSAYLEYCGLIDQSIVIDEPAPDQPSEVPAVEQGSVAEWILSFLRRIVAYLFDLFFVKVV